VIALYGNLGLRTTEAAGPSTAAARVGSWRNCRPSGPPRHMESGKRNLGPALAATHRKRASPLVELGEAAAFVAGDRAAAMTGRVANLTGGEIVD
jgi:hypothetical protein